MLNYKHLHYFRVVARAGSIARACEQLHVTPQTVSGQLALFEGVLGQALFERRGRRLVLNDAGRLVASYAEEIFAIGEELESVLRDRPRGRPVQLRVGVADAVPKSLAYALLEPALALPEPLRLVCREGKLPALLGDLATHRLDLVLADSPMPPTASVRAYSHLLGECGLSFFGTPALATPLRRGFPGNLDGVPLLLPGEDTVVRSKLARWFDRIGVRPRVVGEFDDGALLKAFGRAGAGVFPAPTAVAAEVARQYGVEPIGATRDVTEQFYAISIEQRITHPAVIAIRTAARDALFASERPRAAARPRGRTRKT
jgi:LysR family transcriptional activator of nhaA